MSTKLKVAVLGSGGILGQHLAISVPSDIEAIFVRKTPSPLAESLDLTDWRKTETWLNACKPDVIINLAGESRPDVVERDPKAYEELNRQIPLRIGEWCDSNGSHLVHISSQAAIDRVNAYGKQKEHADYCLQEGLTRQGERKFTNWTIVRPTFVLGIRPFPGIGRENPAEAMLSGTQQQQVDNRFFSVSFAWDVADALWAAARKRESGKVIQIGNPERLSRYELCKLLIPTLAHLIEPLTQEHLEAGLGIAPRPLDTTYVGAHFETPLGAGLDRLRGEYNERARDGDRYRAKELAAFLKVPYWQVERQLAQGFGPLHNEVTADFNRTAPKTDDELLNWYRTTLAYLFELSAYHCDVGFNYSGMCEGIITRLKHAGAKRVLCLGDGVGTLTIKMREAGMKPVYHDLEGSRTAAFAEFRYYARFGEDLPTRQSVDWNPPTIYEPFDAVCSLDFLEHCVDVQGYVRWIWSALKPGGLFCAQSAFAMGSGTDGAMPMHLERNDHYEVDWDPMLSKIGFQQISSNWYFKPVAK